MELLGLSFAPQREDRESPRYVAGFFISSLPSGLAHTQQRAHTRRRGSSVGTCSPSFTTQMRRIFPKQTDRAGHRMFSPCDAVSIL
jgi:hypothetical protein